MSAVSGLASKGEKGKSKFQSLDINSLYRSSLGESAEPQQKALPRKHGMQSLGKVPSARRPPANLPSLKSEHSGQEPPVSLVPSGGAGWGAKESEETGGPSSSQPATTTPHSTSASGAPTPASSLPPSQVPPPVPSPAPVASSKSSSTSSSGPQEKLWSSLMSGSNSQGGPDGGPSFLAHQNPMFQQEFPSLSTELGAKGATTQDVQYGPGPSLRPQTEGSWIQGGMSRASPQSGGSTGGMDGRGGAMEPGKGSSGPLGGAQPPSGPGGPAMAAPLPPQLRGIIPPFMYRGNNFGPGGGPPSNFPPNFQGNGRQRYAEQSRQQPGQRHAHQRPVEDDGLFSRPIIKEEDLKQMDEIVRDNGWATADDIDYNQKLSFSDEEGDENTQNRPSKQSEKQENVPRGQRGGSFSGKQAFGGSNANPPIRLNEDDEIWRERRRQQSEEVALAVERAKQRKEEEEKRFKEQREAAAKKLEMLEKKMGVSSSNKPEQQVEKEVEEKQKASSEGPESWAKQVEEPSSRQETIQPYPTENERDVRKERPREAGHENVAFSSKFSEDLPPRFAKQKQMLLRTGKPGQKGASPPPQDNTPPPLLANPVAPPPNFEQRWGLQNFTVQGRGQGRRRSSQEQEDFEDQKIRDQDKHRHGGSNDRHERDRFPGGRRDGRKISESSRGLLKDKSEDDHYGRQHSSEERSEHSEMSSRDKDYGISDRMDLQQPQIDPFDDKDLGQKMKDATPPPLITDITLKVKTQRQTSSDKWPSAPIQHQRQDSERSDDSRGKRGPKPEAWSRGDDSLVAKLRGDDDSRLDTASPKKDEQGKVEDDRKGSSKGRSQRGDRGPRSGQASSREGRDNREGRDSRDNRENRDSNWSSGGSSATAFQKTWARTGSGSEGKPLEGRGKGRGSKLHPVSGGKPGKAWEDDSDHSDEEIIPKETDRRVRKAPKQLKDSPEEKKGTIIGDKKMGEKLSGRGANNKEGFAPRGEPSRRGRGGGGGSSRVRGGIGRGIDGYGPPAKSPFGNRDENRKPDSKMGEDINKTKLGGMVPLSNSAGTNASKQNKQPAMPPRMQKTKEGSDRSGRRKGKGGKSPNRADKPISDEHNEENWESLSDSEDDQDGRGPRKGASPRGNHFNLASSGNLTTSKAPGAEKKNGLGSVGARTMNQAKKEALPLTEAAKRLEKEQSALNALDISTYAAVTSLVDDQIAADQDGSQQFLAYNYQKKKRSNSPPRERISGRGGKNSGPFGQQPPPQQQQQQQQMGMKPAPKSGNYERSHDRARVSKLPPRLAKQKEHNRMQKAAAGNMPHHMGADMLDMYVGHDPGHLNSWDKSLAETLRSGSPLTSCVNLMEPDGAGGGLPVPQIAQGEGEDTADMKLDFSFDSSELLDDKNKTRTGVHSVSSAPSSSSANSTISPSTAELNLKIASVKKVWENATMPTVLEHSQDEFSTSGFDQSLDSSFKESSAEDNAMQSEISYSGGQTIVTGGSYAAGPGGLSATIAGKTDPTTTSSNVCKVKPQQQQMAMSAGQSPIGHQNQLSPPPFTSSTSSQHGHLGYQTVQRSAGMDNMSCWQHTGSAAPAFGGISAIPSPPTVLFNTNQQLAQASGLYNTFQLENQRSQFSQYPPYGLNSNNAATGFSQQSLYMQQPPPPPPTAQGYDINPPSLSQYRLQATAAPYGQNQHVTSNPSTVLISTTSNSLMSASVKPSTQPIGAIGSKGYQTSAPPPPPQPNTMYIYEHPAAANLLGLSGPGFMSNSGGLVQRPNPVQNNVVPTIQAPSSYFSNSAPGQGGFYQTNNPPPHPNAGGGGLHNSNNPYATNISGFAQNTGNTGTMPGFGTTQQQMVAAAAAVQSYRNQGGVNANYMKSSQQGSQDLGSRQLKSPAQEQLGASVFSNTQMNISPKGRGNPGGGNKQPPLPSPTLGQQQNQQQQGQKYGGYPTTNAIGLQSQNLVGGRNSGPRGPPYPSPIQRPNFQTTNMPAQNRPRMPSNQQQRGKTNHAGQGGSHMMSKMEQPSGERPQLPNSNKETNGTALTPPTTTAAAVDPKKVVEKKASPAPPPVPVVAKPAAPAPAPVVVAPPVESKEESITKEESSSKPAQCVE